MKSFSRAGCGRCVALVARRKVPPWSTKDGKGIRWRWLRVSDRPASRLECSLLKENGHPGSAHISKTWVTRTGIHHGCSHFFILFPSLPANLCGAHMMGLKNRSYEAAGRLCTGNWPASGPGPSSFMNQLSSSLHFFSVTANGGQQFAPHLRALPFFFHLFIPHLGHGPPLPPTPTPLTRLTHWSLSSPPRWSQYSSTAKPR